MRGLKRVRGLAGPRAWSVRRLLGAALLCVVAPAGFAQIVPPSLDACATESDSAKRLACFDREIAHLHQLQRAQGSGAPARAGQAPSSETASTAGAGAPPGSPTGSAGPPDPNDPAVIDRFGVTPDMQRQRQGDGKAPPPLREISAHIVSVHYLPRGEIVVRLDNGQTWQQAEYDGDVTLDIGEAVTIKTGALGAFYLRPHRGRIVRVRRLR